MSKTKIKFADPIETAEKAKGHFTTFSVKERSSLTRRLFMTMGKFETKAEFMQAFDEEIWHAREDYDMRTLRVHDNLVFDAEGKPFVTELQYTTEDLIENRS